MQKEIEALSIFPVLSTIEWRHHISHVSPWLPEPSRKEEKIKAATILLRRSKFQGDKRIIIHHPFNMPGRGLPIVPGVASVPIKEEDDYEEVFKLPQEAK